MSGEPDIRLVAFAGSTREQSFNKALIRVAAIAAEEAGAEVSLIDLRDHPLPIYDGDLEAREGLPRPCLELRELVKSSAGLLIATPEYNGFFPPVLKNALDWISRPHGEDGLCACYAGKVVGLLGASPGRLGALRAVTVLRQQMAHLGCIVLPDVVTLPAAHEIVSDPAGITDERTLRRVRRLSRATVELARRVARDRPPDSGSAEGREGAGRP